MHACRAAGGFASSRTKALSGAVALGIHATTVHTDAALGCGRATEGDMDNDDALVGRLLSRREAIALLAAAGGAWAGWATAAGARPLDSPGMCVARPQLTEGPYFVDERLHRADIRAIRRTARCASARRSSWPSTCRG